MPRFRNSAKAVIIEDNRLLAIQNTDVLDRYHTLPGGGQRPFETLTDALKRECTEEIGVRVEVGDLLFIREYIGKNHEFAEKDGAVKTALILDIDLHFGDGTVNILGEKPWATVVNPNNKGTRESYLDEVAQTLSNTEVDIIGVSAGFDLHRNDWGGLLPTENYQEIGRLVRQASRRSGAGLFAILEGGYNQEVLGQNVSAFLDGLSD